jgi:hypothetical protein
MLQRREELGLVPVAIEQLGVLQILFVNLLDGDFATQLVIARAVDGGEASGADLVENRVPVVNLHAVGSEQGWDRRLWFPVLNRESMLAENAVAISQTVDLHIPLTGPKVRVSTSTTA